MANVANIFEIFAQDDQDPSLHLRRRLLQLLSPLVREAVSGLPVLATFEPLTKIVPDTPSLVLNGRTNVYSIAVLLNED